ncbi:uncharacterized protein HMPREF1541_04137 [Cyphellophora europaea CBS 101466]|uniref:P-loop containing nucleoside triphosphate hydrolase protein n=1 Tax=Cyphellophora europaea (strain CBS 101466) TaxID=1220924 RepID=W2S0D0_CYPE1|nr:uncharacterized protein HMPREF1541_04137 [Cyphellophora europaea CBS 101466]ETN42196.1 hypothetical protein HMPREF1541_04137 [Cyphellophora europaea CBS 101466]
MPLYPSYDSAIWQMVEWWYRIPEPPPRTRDPAKPLQVIAVGFSRAGTESLQHALTKLGYDYCYHGWDMLLEEPQYSQAWTRLARKKWHSKTGDCRISAAEFDGIIGHAVAVVDVPASCFAAELIEAYPEAKVICNQRRDVDKWYASAVKHIVEEVNESRFMYFLTWFDAEFFWKWTSFERYLLPRSFHATDSSLGSGIRSQGKRVQREHMNAVRGQLYHRGETHRLLDWYLEDGWEPLCKFLGKPVPQEPFPRTNDAKGFEGRVESIVSKGLVRAVTNASLFFGGVALCTSASIWWRWYR